MNKIRFGAQATARRIASALAVLAGAATFVLGGVLQAQASGAGEGARARPGAVDAPAPQSGDEARVRQSGDEARVRQSGDEVQERAALDESEAPQVRDEAQALDWLDDASAPRRAAAVLWLARNRGAEDAPRVAPALHDAHPLVRVIAEQAMWQMWSRSGDDGIDLLLAQGSEQMRAGDLAAAIATFDEVIRRKPAFAEGWNKRATALYLAGEYRRSLTDCDQVMRRNPLHFGALSGYGQIYVQLGRYETALEYFRRALAVNPNLDGVRANIRRIERLLEARERRSV
ncbi:MAG: tetratricopeptide repeat protein [Burkholderiales bacterium]|nr:MAG: tetratricopeptide repeat protein [Burkholderiales bacterium]